MVTLRNHIAGEWVESSASDCLEITNPATAEPLGRVPLSTSRDVDQAVAAARAGVLQLDHVGAVPDQLANLAAHLLRTVDERIRRDQAGG